MNHTEVTLPSGCFLMVEVPEGSTHWFPILDGRLQIDWIDGKTWNTKTFSIPVGDWETLGADPTQLTEVEAGEIVEDEYGQLPDFEHEGCTFPSKATASLDSLAAANGIKKPYVILKKK